MLTRIHRDASRETPSLRKGFVSTYPDFPLQPKLAFLRLLLLQSLDHGPICPLTPHSCRWIIQKRRGNYASGSYSKRRTLYFTFWDKITVTLKVLDMIRSRIYQGDIEPVQRFALMISSSRGDVCMWFLCCELIDPSLGLSCLPMCIKDFRKIEIIRVCVLSLLYYWLINALAGCACRIRLFHHCH